MDVVPSKDSVDWPLLMTFAATKLNIGPRDFWGLTYGEFWPLYNAVMGNVIQPMSEDELEDLESAWVTKATDGNKIR